MSRVHRRECHGYHTADISCEHAMRLLIEQARRDLWRCRWSRIGAHKFIAGSVQCINGACECTYPDLQESRRW